MFGKILQMAAITFGSNTEMTDSIPGKNNYMIDRVTAYVWNHQYALENAEQKFKAALLDVEAASFLKEEEKDLEIANILENLALVYKRGSQYENALIYHAAAKTINGDISDYIECDIYSHLRHYKEAIQACDPKDGYEARFYRARAYKALGKMQESQEDFKVVADSESDYREAVFFEMSNTYGALLKDYAGELKLFEEHPYVFDESYQSKDNLALAYNNRCYTYMHLNQLQKALDDCETSLKFGDMPDAHYKKQLILKRMEVK